MADEREGNMRKMAGIAAFSMVAGAVTAAMFTPKSGRELRSKLRGKAKDIGGKAKHKLHK